MNARRSVPDRNAKKGGLADSPFFAQAATRAVEPLPPAETAAAETKASQETEKAVYQSGDEWVDRPTDPPIDQPVDRSTAQPVQQPTRQATRQAATPSLPVDALGPVVARPRSFYITQKLDRWLDEAVRYLRDGGLHKADRSVLVNALLHNSDLFTPAALDQLRERLLTHMTNRALRRSESTR